MLTRVTLHLTSYSLNEKYAAQNAKTLFERVLEADQFDEKDLLDIFQTNSFLKLFVTR